MTRHHTLSLRALLPATLLGLALAPALASAQTPPASEGSTAPTPDAATVAPATNPTAATEAPPSTATETPTPAESGAALELPTLTLGVRAGLGVPTLFNELDLSYDVALEVGYVLPFLDGRLAVVADVGYSAPTASGGGNDARVGASGGAWTYEITNERLTVSLGPIFRIFPTGSTFVPYVGALGRAYFVRTTANGTGAGQPFGENVETSMAYGVVGVLGGELKLGPGAALLEVSAGWAALAQTITGETTAGVLAAQLGYRLFL
jgi:hypothetical protein